MSSWAAPAAPPPTYDSHSSMNSHSRLRPYLQLPHLLSLTWLAYPILSLVFVVFRLEISLGSSQDAVSSAKSDLLASCRAAEQAATAAASMPRFMATATNDQIASAVNDSMNAAREALVLALTIMEVIINFVVDIYRSTFLCFLELVIQGGLAIMIGAVKELNVVVGAAANGIRTVVQDAFDGANKVLSGLAKVASVVHVTIPTLTVPDLTSLENVTLPQSFSDALTNLNNSLPTFNELKQTVEQFIDTSFELLKADINDTFSGLSFNSTILPVPERNTLAFCTDLDTSFVDNLGRDLVKITKIGILILIIVIIILIGLNCLLEWYKWRCQQQHLEYTRQAWNSDPSMVHVTSGGTPTVALTDHNLLMLQANGAHPLLTRIANNVSGKLRLSPTNHTHLSWFLHYVFHPPALACFLIGFFGLLSVELQLIAMRPLVDKYSAQAASTATDFSNTIATSINASMFNQSAVYASAVNSHIDAIQSTVNDGLFGWVNTTTTTLNTTIENFYEDIQHAVDVVFNGTILDAPIQTFIQCIIGSKVDAIEQALTFLHNNLNINIPRVNDSILVLSPDSVNEATKPIAAAAVGQNGDGGGLVGKIVNSYENALRKERLMFGVFMGLWGLVVLMAIAVLLYNSYGRAYLEKRGRRRWEREQRTLPLAAGAFEKGFEPNGGGGGGGGKSELPSFTPLPSPKLGGAFNLFRNNKNGSSDSVDHNRSWDTFFEKPPKSARSVREVKTISKPMKLVGKNAQRGQEILVPDSAISLTEPEAEPDRVSRRDTKWFMRVATLLARKEESPTIEPFPTTSAPQPPPLPNRPRPALQITVDSPGSLSAPSAANVPPAGIEDRSRWSVSPQNTSRPWTGLISPTAGRHSWRHKHKPSVPSNVDSVDGDASLFNVARASVTPFAVPLHSGFDIPRRQPISPLHPVRQTKAHRRSLSIPPTNVRRMPVASVVPGDNPFADSNARVLTAANPFITPFDDEHRVQLDHADRAGARKSVSTNPFA